MAAAAPTGASHEVLHTTHKKANFQRIARLLVAGGTALMREIFDQYFNTPLQFHLKLNVPFVKNKIKRAKLTKPCHVTYMSNVCAIMAHKCHIIATIIIEIYNRYTSVTHT